MYAICETLKKAGWLAWTASSTVLREESLERGLRTATVDTFENLSSLINEYVRICSTSNINCAMRIRLLVIRCNIFRSAIKGEDYSLQPEDFRCLFRCLRQLAELIDTDDG